MLFDKKRYNTSTRQLDHLVDNIRMMVNSDVNINPRVAKTAIATESFTDSDLMELNSSVNNIRGTIEGICESLNLSTPTLSNSKLDGLGLEAYQNYTVSPAQIDAGTAAAIISGDIRGFLNSKIKGATAKGEYEHVVGFAPADSSSTRSNIFSLSNESYNEHSLKEATIYSIAYNMQASRQDDFCETFFPTIVITPDQVGFGIVISLIGVFDDFKHKLTAERAAFIRRNIVHSVVNPNILKNDLTRLVPVYRSGDNADKFASASDITPRTVDLEGIKILTQPYKPNVEINVIGACTTDDVAAAGLMDITDTIDTGVVLENIYLKVQNSDKSKKDILRFNVSTLHLSNFTETPQGMSQTMMLLFKTTSLLVNRNTLQNDGSALNALAGVKTGDYRFRLATTITGSIRLDSGTLELLPGKITVSRIINAANEPVDKSDGGVAELVTALENAEIIGYDIKAYRVNNNRRTRGQLITTWEYTQKYNVFLRSPITALSPINSSGEYNTNDLNALITATRIRTSNCAVGTLIDAATYMSEFIDARDEEDECPDILGLGGMYVRPTYFLEDIDVNESIDSLKSHERAADIQAVLVNKIRDYVFRMYRDSEYKAAADILSGGIGPMPTVIIGTDPVISRYLQINGDLRTVGGGFNVKIVSTLDIRVAGKMFITFATFDESRNTTPNILNFGNHLYSPEITIQVPITRDNAISNELAVQPRFLHVVHLPIMTVLQVNGISDSLNKVPIEITNLNTESVVSVTYSKTKDIAYDATKIYYRQVGGSFIALSAGEARAKFQAANGSAPADVFEIEPAK